MEQPKPQLDNWGGKCSEPQSAMNMPPRLPLHSNPIFKPQLATFNSYDVDNYDLMQLLNTSASYR